MLAARTPATIDLRQAYLRYEGDTGGTADGGRRAAWADAVLGGLRDLGGGPRCRAAAIRLPRHQLSLGGAGPRPGRARQRIPALGDAGTRAAVVLRFYEDLSFAQIALILDCTESTARSHVHRAVAALRARLIESEASHD
ncbi:MAG: RNA polymerase sigma factor [Pseudonocardiaceae bacterium]